MRPFLKTPSEEAVRVAVEKLGYPNVSVAAVRHHGGRWCEACDLNTARCDCCVPIHPAHLRVTTIILNPDGDGIRSVDVFSCLERGLPSTIHNAKTDPATVCVIVGILNGVVADTSKPIGECYKCGIVSDQFSHCPNCGRVFTFGMPLAA